MQNIKMIINKKFLVLFFLFIVGIVHWFLFINFGDPNFKYFDLRVDHQLYDTIKQAVKEFRIPYHVAMYDLPIVQYGDNIYESRNSAYEIRWFANKFPIVSPHLILLSYFDVPIMMTFNIIIHFSLGFLGILLWIKKLNLSISSSIFLILIWSFNGFVVAEIGVGHLHSRSAYLLIPIFFWLIYQFIQGSNLVWRENIKNVILFSLLIFFMKLNGNGQTVYQFLFVGFVIILFYPRRWFWYIGALVLSMLLMTFYIVPTLMFTDTMGGNRIMQYGYGTGPFDLVSMQWGLEKIFAYIFNIIYHLWVSLTVSFNASYDGQVIYNLYISLLGLILLCCSSITFLIQIYKKKMTFNLRIFFAFCIILILSFSNFSIEFHKLTFKYISAYPLIDRQPAYLAIYPLSLLFLIAALGFDNFFQIFPSKIIKSIKYVSLMMLLYFLLSHSYEWFIISTESHAHLVLEEMQDVRVYSKVNILNMPGDKNYINIVNMSYLFSFLISIILLFVLFLIRKKN